ncbi:hypothetical protein IMAU30078_00154 [Lactobacillus helveticus]|nr:hypothetical protein [Lactobacillus helveticus]
MTKSIKEMSLETQENYDKLMTYLMNYAMFDHSIGVEFTDKLPPFAQQARQTNNHECQMVVPYSNTFFACT